MTLLLIHTGGTIGMVSSAQGLVPQAGLLESALEARLPAGVGLRAEVFAPLLDSADIGPEHWNHILDIIEKNPDAPVIVTHGTDTMSYSGTALAQALAGSGRLVVLCGAMVPLGMGGDAEANLDLALARVFAGGAGVYLAFAGRILPAEGLVKHDSHGADAFRSQPQAPLPCPAQRRFDPRARLAVLTLTPGLHPDTLAAMLAPLDGAVLRVYGTGTVAQDARLLTALAAAKAAGKRLRAVSQCEAGGLAPGTYAAGAALWATGVENGGTQTPEAALARIWLGE